MDKQTIDTYNHIANEYDAETTDFWERFPRTIIDTFAGSVQGSVLDVGSGPGRDGLILKGKGLQVTCLDASQTMVALSTSRGLPSVLGDFSALPFPDASFDGVWCYTALLHVPKEEVSAALAEIHRVLKSGGIFGLGLIEGELSFYKKDASTDYRPRWFSYYKKSEVEMILARHGFSILYFEEFTPRFNKYLNFICRKD